jgi:alkylation response protein AidB-like acyl-CoA dehydrogenase
MSDGGLSPAERIREWSTTRVVPAVGRHETNRPDVAGSLVEQLVGDGLAVLPLPAQGDTWARFEALAALGEIDLTVGRLVEAHVDALAILAELDDEELVDRGGVWAVWAAEPPSARVGARRGPDGSWRLAGRKAWCSGAGITSKALVTAHAPDGPRLFAVDLRQPGVQPADDPWPAAALAGTDTRSVDLLDAFAIAVGGPEDYVRRAGFWFGAVGVAAVWHGGAVGVARCFETAMRARELGDIEAAHLGGVVAALMASRSSLREAARSIDMGEAVKPPYGELVARATRAVVEESATTVIDRVGRALGPSPLAMDGAHARRVTDLQLYLRQSHAERDLAELGRRVREADVVA